MLQKKKIIIFFHDFIMGGSETLILRIIRWLVENKHEVTVICKSCIEYFEFEFQKSNIELIKVSDYSYKKIKNILCKISTNVPQEQYYITFFMDDFIFTEKLLHNKKNILNIFYILHPLHTIALGRLEKIKKPFNKRILKTAYNQNKLVFMDEDCISVCEKHYNLNLKDEYKKIIRLPMKINSNPTEPKKKKEDFNILTITRLDFPFKGYVLGLIDDFAELKKIYSKITLTIIGDGKGKEVVEKKIKQIDTKTQQDIFLKGTIPYNQLDSYFKKADVYVGMGTTLLDASNNGLISITVYSYTYQFFATGFYYENPQILCGLEFGLAYPKVDGISLLKKIINMKQNEYQELSQKSFFTLKKIYDIERVMRNLMKIKLIEQKKENYKVFSINTAIAMNKISRIINKK